jgi:hypothetical protein
LFCGAAAKADSFPSGKIRIVVPTAAAGVADSLARIVGAKVQDNIGQTVYVEDRPGARRSLSRRRKGFSPSNASRETGFCAANQKRSSLPLRFVHALTTFVSAT